MNNTKINYIKNTCELQKRNKKEFKIFVDSVSYEDCTSLESCFKSFLNYGNHLEKYSRCFLSGEIASILLERMEKYFNAFKNDEEYNDINDSELYRLATIKTYATIKHTLNKLNFATYENCSKNANITTLDNLLNQWIYRDGRTEQKKVCKVDFNSCYNVENDNTQLDYELQYIDNSITMDDIKLIKNKVSELKKTNNFNRIETIIKNNLVDNASKKALSKYKKMHNIDGLSRTDLNYLFMYY